MTESTAARGRRNGIDIGALEQRVYGTENSIKNLGDQTVALVAGLRQDTFQQISQLSLQISGLASKIDDQQKGIVQSSRVNWMAIIGSMAGVVGTGMTILAVIGSLITTPIQSTQSRHDTEIVNLANNTVPKEEIRERWRSGDARFERLLDTMDQLAEKTVRKDFFDEFERRNDERFKQRLEDERRIQDRMMDDIKNLQANLVSRDENKVHWAQLADRLDRQSTRINDLVKQSQSSYTPGDQLKNLQSQLDQLRSALAMPMHHDAK